MTCLGDHGPIAEGTRALVAHHPDITLMTLTDYAGFTWSDAVADRPDDISAALMVFIERMEQQYPSAMQPLAPGGGEIAGLTLPH